MKITWFMDYSPYDTLSPGDDSPDSQVADELSPMPSTDVYVHTIWKDSRPHGSGKSRGRGRRASILTVPPGHLHSRVMLLFLE